MHWEKRIFSSLLDLVYEIDLPPSSTSSPFTFSYANDFDLSGQHPVPLLPLLVLIMTEPVLKQLNQSYSSVQPQQEKLIIYQILVRLFGNRNPTNLVHGTIAQNGVGKMNDINDACLRELKRFGYSHVWYCGVLEHATMTDYRAYGIRPDNPYIVK